MRAILYFLIMTTVLFATKLFYEMDGSVLSPTQFVIMCACVFVGTTIFALIDLRGLNGKEK